MHRSLNIFLHILVKQLQDRFEKDNLKKKEKLIKKYFEKIKHD